MSPERITDLRQISDKVLVDLKTWLEPWFPPVRASVSGGGDYVFLDQQHAIIDDWLTFSDIDQSFETLVMEAKLYQDGGANGDDLQDLWVQWGPDSGSFLTSGYVSGAERFYSADNPTAAEGLFRDWTADGHPELNDDAVIVPEVVPGTFRAGMQITAKFGFYRSTAITHRSVIVEAVTFPFGGGDNGIDRAIARGGGANLSSTDAIGAIRLNAALVGTQGLAVGSVASLYGIRGPS